ncbi:MAG: RibD family protein, partial [Terriglobales bacterium]
AALQSAGARVEKIAAGHEGRVSLEAALRRLGELEIMSVLAEAGAEVNAALLAGGWADKLVLFQAPLLLGGAGVPLAAGALALRLPEALAAECVGPDLLIEAYLGSQPAASEEGAISR